MTYIDNHLQRVSSHEQAEGQAPLTEPEIVSSDFVTGGCFEVSTSTVRFTFWEEIQNINGEMAERRTNTRIVMTNDTAREIMVALRRALTRDGH